MRPPRLLLWRAAWRMWIEHPLTGVGADNFRLVYGRYAGLSPFDDRITANNIFFETLATVGVVGLAAWAWLAAVLVRLVARGLARPPRMAPLGAAVAAGLLAFAAHGLVDHFLEFTPTYGLFWLLVGAGARSWTDDAALDAGPPASETGAARRQTEAPVPG
jgi:O-antigen ligase